MPRRSILRAPSAKLRRPGGIQRVVNMSQPRNDPMCMCPDNTPPEGHKERPERSPPEVMFYSESRSCDTRTIILSRFPIFVECAFSRPIRKLRHTRHHRGSQLASRPPQPRRRCSCRRPVREVMASVEADRRVIMRNASVWRGCPDESDEFLVVRR